MAVTAFVARSFDPKDELRIRPILNFLETFRKAGFLWEEAEAAEVESVSVKVRKLIGSKDAFIGFFTRKYPVYALEPSLGSAFSLACGKLVPEKWSAPAWVLQESGFALAANKKLILLREDGVEIPGLQGDLEYVPFDPLNPSSIFGKLSEMVNDLLAKAAGREIKTEVSEQPEQVEAKPEAQTSKQEEKLSTTADEPQDLITRFIEMADAGDNHDLSKAYEAWQAGSELIANGNGGTIDRVQWDSWYFRIRYQAGAADSLDSLRRLRRENPQRTQPLVSMALIFRGVGEHEEAAKLFLEAAKLSEGNEKASSLVDAARALKELKQYEGAIKLVENALQVARGDARDNAIPLLYDLLKNSGETFLAFGLAESALRENPLLGLRFDLGLDYRRGGFKELGLHHFKLLHEQKSDDSAALHNLALMYADCELPITAVTHYKQSFTLGNSLSSANLGFTYLDAGMSEEALDLIKKAMALNPHDNRVEACLADIQQRPEDEAKKESELLGKATGQKEIFARIGKALHTSVSNLDGCWQFPFGQMTLIHKETDLSGTGEVTREAGALSSLLFARPAETGTKYVERYALAGTLKGAVCEFTLNVARDTSSPFNYAAASLAGSDVGTSKSGYIVFEASGRQAMYVETRDGKFGAPKNITKC